jgi:hypothetical protein
MGGIVAQEEGKKQGGKEEEEIKAEGNSGR